MSWPLVVSEALAGAAIISGSEYLYQKAGTYFESNNKLPAVSSIPTSKKKISSIVTKTSQKQNLKRMSDGVATSIGLGVLSVGGLVHNIASGADEKSRVVSADKNAKISETPNSPLLKNQLEIAKSSDAIVDAINANSIVTASLLGTLDQNLASISVALLAISGTLIDISTNYNQELNNTEDLPYIDSESYYDMLKDSGLSEFQIQSLKQSENLMIEGMMARGNTFSEIKEAVQQFRSVNVPATSQMEVDKKINGLSSPSQYVDQSSVSSGAIQKINSSAPLDSTAFPDFTPLFDWANSAKIVSDYMGTPTSTTDADGLNPISATPMELQSIKNASDARHKTDLNNDEYDENDFPSLGDLIPMPLFIGRDTIFNPNFQYPSVNPFMPQLP